MSRPDPAGARPTGLRRLAVTVAVTAWLVAFAVFLVWSRARTYQLGYEVAHAGAEQSRLVDEHHSLQLERTTLRSPTRVGAAAHCPVSTPSTPGCPSAGMRQSSAPWRERPRRQAKLSAAVHELPQSRNGAPLP